MASPAADHDDFFSADLSPPAETTTRQGTCTLACVSQAFNPFQQGAPSGRQETRQEYLAKKKIAHEKYISGKADRISKKRMTGRDGPAAGEDGPAADSDAVSAAAAPRGDKEWLLKGV